MTNRIEAQGEKWDAVLSRERPHAGVSALIFRCATNSSYGWRVVEVAAAEVPDQERVEGLSDGELRTLFDRSQPFDYSHDPHARQDVIDDAHGR